MPWSPASCTRLLPSLRVSHSIRHSVHFLRILLKMVFSCLSFSEDMDSKFAGIFRCKAMHWINLWDLCQKKRDIQMDVSSFSVADMGFEPFNCKCPVGSCWPGSVPTTPYDVFPTGNPSTPNSIIHSIKNRYLGGSVPLFSWKETNLDRSACRHPGGNYRWYALQHTGRNSQIIILFYSVCMLFILFFYFSSAYQIIKNKVHFLYSVCPAETFACVANISRICIIIYNKYVRMIR